MKYIIFSIFVFFFSCKSKTQTKIATVDSTKYYERIDSYEKEKLDVATQEQRIADLKLAYSSKQNHISIFNYENKENRNDFFAYYRINKKYTGKLYPFEDKNIKIDSIRYWVSSFVSDTTAEFGSFYILNFRSKQKETIGSRIYILNAKDTNNLDGLYKTVYDTNNDDILYFQQGEWKEKIEK